MLWTQEKNANHVLADQRRNIIWVSFPMGPIAYPVSIPSGEKLEKCHSLLTDVECTVGAPMAITADSRLVTGRLLSKGETSASLWCFNLNKLGGENEECLRERVKVQIKGLSFEPERDLETASPLSLVSGHGARPGGIVCYFEYRYGVHDIDLETSTCVGRFRGYALVILFLSLSLSLDVFVLHLHLFFTRHGGNNESLYVSPSQSTQFITASRDTSAKVPQKIYA